MEVSCDCTTSPCSSTTSRTVTSLMGKSIGRDSRTRTAVAGGGTVAGDTGAYEKHPPSASVPSRSADTDLMRNHPSWVPCRAYERRCGAPRLREAGGRPRPGARPASRVLPCPALNQAPGSPRTVAQLTGSLRFRVPLLPVPGELRLLFDWRSDWPYSSRDGIGSFCTGLPPFTAAATFGSQVRL